MKLGIHPQVDGKYNPSSRSINHNVSNNCHLSKFGTIEEHKKLVVDTLDNQKLVQDNQNEQRIMEEMNKLRLDKKNL
jgi:hypothetical protein